MNQYRCETCKHFDETTVRYCTCHKIDEQIDGSEIALISRLSCASHSDFQSEREKLLIELKSWCETLGEIAESDAKQSENFVESSGELGKCIAYRVVAQKIEELRKVEP